MMGELLAIAIGILVLAVWGVLVIAIRILLDERD